MASGTMKYQNREKLIERELLTGNEGQGTEI